MASRCLVLLPSFTCQHPIPAPHSLNILGPFVTLLFASSFSWPSCLFLFFFLHNVNASTHRLSPSEHHLCNSTLQPHSSPKIRISRSVNHRTGIYLAWGCMLLHTNMFQTWTAAPTSATFSFGSPREDPTLSFLSVFPDLVNAVTTVEDVTES